MGLFLMCSAAVFQILSPRNPVSGKWEEKHLQTPPSVPMDRRSHLYGFLPAKRFPWNLTGPSFGIGLSEAFSYDQTTASTLR